MKILKLNGQEYTLRLEYRELKRLEQIYEGRSFMEIVNILGENPSIHDLETMIYAAVQDKELTREQFSDLLDDALSDPDSGLTFDALLDTFMEAVENSVFIRGMEKQAATETKKANLKKKKAI